MSEEILIWPSTKINNGVTKEAKLAFIGTLLYFSLLSSGVWAGATSYYHPTDGTPLQWQTDSDGKATIEYLVDAGGLGRLTHEQSLQLLQAAMAIWEAEANVEFVYSGTTNEIIDGNNYRDYLVVDESICTDSSTAERVENALQFDRISIIGFDNTANTIMNDADGLSGSGNAVGRTDITCISGTNADPQFITSAQIILNGAYLDGVAGPPDLTVNTMVGVIVHELGHFIGLDHSSANQVLDQMIDSGALDEDTYARYVPTMESTLVVHEDMATLNPDDIAAAQSLYPFADSPTSLVSGNVTDAENSDFRGAQMEMRNIDDPLCEVFSFVSGKQCTPLKIVEGGSTTIVASVCGNDSTNTGQFFLRAIPSGNYTLSAQEVIDYYKGGVIPPFSTEFPIDELVGEAEFYNATDLATEDFDSRTLITVTDAEDLSDLTITLSSTVADGDGEENLIPIDFFSTTNGFTDSLTVTGSRCQPNTVDYAALIGVEELVGSDDGEDDGSDDTTSSAGGCSLIIQ